MKAIVHLRTTRAAGLVAAVAVAMVALPACQSEDVTGEPTDIGALVHVVASGSRCVHDAGADTARFTVLLSNTGGDDRTVMITPVRRFSDGRDVGTSIEGFEITVPGMGEEDHDITVENVSDDLTGCAVRIDGGDAVEVTLQDEAG